MRRTLAATALAAGLALGGAPLFASPAYAASDADVVVAQAAEEDDNTGKWGLLGLTGLFGLFGYKKYQDSRANRDDHARR